MVFAGEFDESLVREKIGEERNYIPELVGVDRLSIGSASGLPTSDDDIYHEISVDSFELTDREPTDSRTIGQFLDALLKEPTSEDIAAAIKGLYSEGMQIYGDETYAVLSPEDVPAYLADGEVPDDLEWQEF